MPTYEYACKSCGEHLEVVQSFKDDPLTVCPACQGQLRKVFGNIGIAFKGSGFYRTDSRSDGRAAAKTSAEKGAGDKGSDSSATASSSSAASGTSGSGTGSSGKAGTTGTGTGSSGTGSSGAGAKSTEAKAS